MEILIAPLTVSKTFKEQELMKESHSRWRKLAVFQLLHYHIVFVCCCFAFAWLCSDIVQNIQCDCVLALCGCVLFSLGICALKKAHMTCGSFQMLPLKQFWCLPDWEWLFFFLQRKTECFLFLCLCLQVVNGAMSLSFCSDFVSSFSWSLDVCLLSSGDCVLTVCNSVLSLCVDAVVFCSVTVWWSILSDSLCDCHCVIKCSVCVWLFCSCVAVMLYWVLVSSHYSILMKSPSRPCCHGDWPTFAASTCSKCALMLAACHHGHSLLWLLQMLMGESCSEMYGRGGTSSWIYWR